MEPIEISLTVDDPQARRDFLRGFLSLNRPMPRNVQNPVEADEVPRLELGGLEEARENLLEEIELFDEYYRNNPGASHTNPVFGELDREGWEKFHYKHCIHHLEQFGLIQAR